MTYNIVMQVLLAVRDKIAYEQAQSEQDWMTWCLAEGHSEEFCLACLKSWIAGRQPEEGEEEGIQWDKYIKWALIGGGIILGTAVLLPVIAEQVRKPKGG